MLAREHSLGECWLAVADISKQWENHFSSKFQNVSGHLNSAFGNAFSNSYNNFETLY